MKIIKNNLVLIILILLSIGSILPFFHNGFFPIHDDTQVTRVFEMKNSLMSGMFPVRWSENLGYGYGYPIFNFYSPLPYYIGGVISLFIADSLVATKILFIIGVISAAISMYYFGRRFFGEFPALVCAIIYLYFPYHAVNIYVRGALAELFAYIFLPVIFLSLFNIHYQKDENNWLKNNLKNIVIGAFGISGVILSHNLSAFMFFIFLPVYLFISLFFLKKKRNKIITYMVTILFGILISSFYFIPALLEMRYTNVASQAGGGSYYPDHFVCIGQLLDSPWGFGGSVKGCVDGMSFRLGKINIFFSLAALVIFLINYKKIKNKFLIGVSFIFLVFSVFMTMDQSTFLWKLIPSIDFLQFPWRFLNFAGVFISILSGFIALCLKDILNKKISLILLVFSLIAILMFNGKLFNPQLYLDRDSAFYTEKDRINWQISKISDEYMPVSFTKPNLESEIPQRKIEIIGRKGSVSVTAKSVFNIKADIDMVYSGPVRINTAYFPAWKLFVDGKEKTYFVKEDGVYFDLQKGKSVVEFKFIQTTVEKISNFLSLIGIMGVFFCIMLFTRKTNINEKTS